MSYHINPKTGNPNLCKATVKSCRFSVDEQMPEHYDTKEEALKVAEKLMKEKFDNNSSMIKSNSVKKDLSHIIPAYNLRLEKINALIDDDLCEYDYEYREDNPETIDDDTLILTYINVDELAEQICEYDPDDSQKISEILKNNGAEDVDNYSLSSYYSLSGNEIDIDFLNKEKTIQEIKEFYYSKDNATDDSGVLDYVRSKGVSTDGMPPIQAIKEQLTKENNGRRSSYVDKSNEVRSGALRIEDIRIGAKHRIDAVEGQEMRSTNGSDNIAGVVYQDYTNGQFFLVDGYHRTKWLKEHDVETAKYIILSSDSKNQN